MQLFSRKKFVLLFSLIAFVALIGAFAVNAVVLRHSSNAAAADPNSGGFQFDLVASPGITACLPKAHGSARILPLPQNDLMTLSVDGLNPNTEYALFVIQVPNKPFGISWYQSDLVTNGGGVWQCIGARHLQCGDILPLSWWSHHHLRPDAPVSPGLVVR